MNNDLISREALKKAVEELVDGGAERLKDYYENGSKSDENAWIGGVYDVWEQIVNAPTVEAYTKDDMTNEYLKGYNACKDIIQPTGKWIPVKQWDNTHIWVCSECKKRNEHGITIEKYCWNCGAKMKGE